MPMVDYLCDSCGYRFENFFHSDAPESQDCPHIECEGGTAKQIHSLPGEHRPINALRFNPIVVWINNDNPDQVSIPGRNDEPVQAGYHAVEIRNISEADRMTRHMNNVTLRDAINQRAAEKQYWEDRTRERRDTIRAQIGGGNAKAAALFKAVCEYTDKKHEGKYNKTLDPRGHFQALSYDSSNRQGHCDESTNWKQRKA
jgi:putative FmdB family regulatory protein